MSSVCRVVAQIAPKKNFAVDINSTRDGEGDHGDIFLQSDFDTWYAEAAAGITKLGSMYIVKNSDNFKNVVDVSSGSDGTLLGHVLGSRTLINYNKRTLVDLGKEICIGIPSNPRLLVFRQVSFPYDSTLQGSGLIGYVVTENNASNLTHPRFYVAVARA